MSDQMSEQKNLIDKQKEQLVRYEKRLREKTSKNPDAQSVAEQKQLKTLTESLAVLTAEKSKMEVNFQSDKKKDLQEQHEARVASLEARLTELSIFVGEYDRLRNSDQQAILTLKDQIMELENRTTRQPIDTEMEKQDSPEKKESASLPSSDDDIHGACREQYDMIIRELEHVKQLQSIQNIHESRSQEENVEYEKLKSQNHNLHERINSLCKKLHHMESELLLQKQNLKLAVEKESEKWSSEVTTLKRQHEAQLNELEDQIRQLRERSLKIIEEKDIEISKLKITLKNTFPASVLTGELSQMLSLDSTSDNSTENNAKSSENPQLFHFSQENARNVVEATLLRKQNFKLEAQVHELTKKCAATSLMMNERIEKLQQEIERHTLSQSREGANLEYLKNVVLRYLTCDDEKHKGHMLTAICTVLRFSKAESRMVLSSKK
ncbi:hypothetical protein B566_EDAN003017 [Ephemera danica]|nr:hypothetical protein B566_EDAN003017 [Ephemera danica]